VRTLNPDGYIESAPGGAKANIAISGGRSSYNVRFVSDPIKGPTAATNYDRGTATIELKASDEARAGNYPLLVADITGSSRLVQIMG